jgi:hypothetical protein
MSLSHLPVYQRSLALRKESMPLSKSSISRTSLTSTTTPSTLSMLSISVSLSLTLLSLSLLLLSARDKLLLALDNPNTFTVALRQSTVPPPLYHSLFPFSDTSNGIKTQLADLFHPSRAHSQIATVHENHPLDTSRSANSPLTADIGFFGHEQGQGQRGDGQQRHHTQEKIDSQDNIHLGLERELSVSSAGGVANFQHDHSSDSASHVMTLSLYPLTPP